MLKDTFNLDANPGFVLKKRILDTNLGPDSGHDSWLNISDISTKEKCCLSCSFFAYYLYAKKNMRFGFLKHGS